MEEFKRITRRESIKWVIAASATASLLSTRGIGANGAVRGYGQDPKLLEIYKPGDLWPLTFTKDQRRTAAVLCDVIIPADEKSPSAGQLSVHDFIDEWISAPYPRQQEDRKIIVDGLSWLDGESKKRFRKAFVDLSDDERCQICDEICFEAKAKPAMKKSAQFFARFRDLTADGFYTTPEGMKDIQYLGNVPLTKFDGPPPEVLAYLKLG
jgi:Gluconate 2-dehydrogenase subunit 3